MTERSRSIVSDIISPKNFVIAYEKIPFPLKPTSNTQEPTQEKLTHEVRTFLLAETLFAIESAFAPQVLEAALIREQSLTPTFVGEHPRKRALFAVAGYKTKLPNYYAAEREAQFVIAKRPDQSSIKRMLSRAIQTGKKFLKENPTKDTSDETKSWGIDNYGRIVASQVLLLNNANISWKEIEEYRNSVIKELLE